MIITVIINTSDGNKHHASQGWVRVRASLSSPGRPRDVVHCCRRGTALLPPWYSPAYHHGAALLQP